LTDEWLNFSLQQDRLDKPLCKPWVYVKKPNNRFNQMNNALLDVEKQQFRDQCHWQWEYLHNIAHMDVHHYVP
jgi:hypothetical protein